MFLGHQRVAPKVKDQRLGTFVQAGDQRFDAVGEPSLRRERVDGEACVRFRQPATEQLHVQLRVRDRGDLAVLLVGGRCDDGEAHDRVRATQYTSTIHGKPSRKPRSGQKLAEAPDFSAEVPSATRIRVSGGVLTGGRVRSRAGRAPSGDLAHLHLSVRKSLFAPAAARSPSCTHWAGSAARV